jgi:hypothetical protein
MKLNLSWIYLIPSFLKNWVLWWPHLFNEELGGNDVRRSRMIVVCFCVGGVFLLVALALITYAKSWEMFFSGFTAYLILGLIANFSLKKKFGQGII